MSTIFLTKYPDSGVLVDLGMFTEALQKRWKFIQIKDYKDGLYALDWFCEESEDNALFIGRLLEDCKTIALEGSLQGCAEFAAWFQELCPEANDLFLLDEGPSFGFYIKELTAKQIREKAKRGDNLLFP